MVGNSSIYSACVVILLYNEASVDTNEPSAQASLRGGRKSSFFLQKDLEQAVSGGLVHTQGVISGSKCIDCIYFIVKCVKMYVTSFQSYHFTLFLMHFTGSWTSILTFMMQYSSELT